MANLELGSIDGSLQIVTIVHDAQKCRQAPLILLIAARIAEASYFGTAMQAVKIGLPGFFLPFLFVARPELLLLEGSALEQLAVVAISLLALAALNVAMVGQGFVRATWPLRALLLIAATLTLVPGMTGTLVGCAVIIAIFSYQYMASARHTASRTA